MSRARFRAVVFFFLHIVVLGSVVVGCPRTPVQPERPVGSPPTGPADGGGPPVSSEAGVDPEPVAPVAPEPVALLGAGPELSLHPPPGPDAVDRLAGGEHAMCLIVSGVPWCWGDHPNLPLLPQADPTPTPIRWVWDAVQLGVSAERGCALQSSGDIRCWGYILDRFGREPRRVTGAPPLRTFSQSPDSACAVARDGSVWCWGAPLSYGDEDPGERPWEAAQRQPVTRAVQVAVGNQHACALLATGGVRCWGALFEILDESDDPDPQGNVYEVPGLADAVQIASGDCAVCALRRDGTVSCWGSRYAERGHCIDTDPVIAPQPVEGLDGVLAVFMGARHACARRRDGSVACWGWDGHGQLGGGTTGGLTQRPVLARDLSGAVDLALANTSTCGLLPDGSVRCLGMNGHGELGAVPGRQPVEVPLNDARWVSVGRGWSCAGDGRQVRCWGGETGRFQIGGYDAAARPDVLEIPEAPLVQGVVIASPRVCARYESGQLRCFDGLGAEGAQQPVFELEAVEQLEQDGTLTCARGRAGEVWCWLATAATPTRMAGLEPATDVAIYSSYPTTRACALTASGEIWCWEVSRDAMTTPVRTGRLEGATDLVLRERGWCAVAGDRLSCGGPGGPTARLGFTGVAQVRGSRVNCLLFEDGRVNCAGWADMLSDLLPESDDTAGQLEGVSDAVALSVASDHGCVLRRAGRVSCFGPATSGELGGRPSFLHLEPMIVPALTSSGAPRCSQTLPGEMMHGGNDDPSAFDLAFSTGGITGGVPIDVAGQTQAPDFGDGDIFLRSPPGLMKLRLRRPLKFYVFGPTRERCDPPPVPAKLAPPSPRATIPGAELRAWARSLKAGGAPTPAAKIPGPVAEELRVLVAQARAGTTLRWLRVLAPANDEAGPGLLVAAHFDRQVAEPLPDGTGASQNPFSLGMLLTVLADDGQRYGLYDSVEGRMHGDAPWSFGAALPLDDDDQPDIILVAPNVADDALQEGFVVALSAWRRVSRITTFPRWSSPERDFTCFGRVDGRPAFLIGATGSPGSETTVRAFVADASGHLVPSGSLYAQLMAWARDPEVFTPVHASAGAAGASSRPFEPADVRLCPGGGEQVDLSVDGGSGDGFSRYWRLSTTRDGVARSALVFDLSRERPIPYR